MPSGLAIRALPVGGVAAAALVVAWRTEGSLAAPDWLPLAIVAACVAAVVAGAGEARRPPRLLLAGAAALAALAAWTAVSIVWAPSPAGARDEALLVALYAVVLLLPGLTLAGGGERRAATGAVVAGLAAIGLLTVVALLTSATPDDLFFFGRLDFPVSYVNASSALFVVGVWPAVALAARREAAVAVRSAAVAAAALALALAVAAQSKGSVLGLVASAVVVLAVSPARLRLLAAFVAAAVPAAALAAPLTEPYRTSAAAASRGVGLAALAATALAALAGALLAAADRRVDIGPARRRVVGRGLLGLLVLAATAGVVAFFVTVSAPGSWLGAKWTAFKDAPPGGGATHLTSLGSNRYDFWRVALDETVAHPLRGLGGRGFFSAYLEHRRSLESPLRAHSLYFDTLSELGVPGLLLLLAAIGLPALLLIRRRASLTAAGSLGAAAYFFAHAAVDWIWTVPVVVVPALLLVGIGATGDAPPRIGLRPSLAVAVAAAALALLAFAPPWLSYRYSSNGDVARARTLDPLSLEPYWAEWRAARTPAERAAPLEQARRREPTSIAVLYQLGLAYLDAGRKRAAVTMLARAHALDPRDQLIVRALDRARD